MRVDNWEKKSYFSTKTYVVSTQKNCLNAMVLLSTLNIYVKTLIWIGKINNSMIIFFI